MTTSVDRIQGLSGNVAFKVPCRVATTANITLNDTQTVDGIALAADDRVLVKDQTDGSENGIYVVKADADWERAKDWNGARDIVKGTQVRITDGTANGNETWEVTTADDITIGTTSVTLAQVT